MNRLWAIYFNPHPPKKRKMKKETKFNVSEEVGKAALSNNVPELALIANNKTIALFMGWTTEETAFGDMPVKIWRHSFPAPYYISEVAGKNAQMFINNEWVDTSFLKYHQSWEWLMPVVEKIESIGSTYVECGKLHCKIQPIFYNRKRDCMEWQITHETRGTTKIEAVYAAVISFINWYNQQQTLS